MLYKGMKEADYELFCKCTVEEDPTVRDQDYKNFIDSLSDADRKKSSANHGYFLDMMMTHCVRSLIKAIDEGSEAFKCLQSN